MTQPIIDVILPTIRTDDWLSVAASSVLSQDIDGLRLIVVFDGTAPDARLPWLSDSRVVTVCLPARGGLPAALNAGLEVSVAPLIARLDADDIDEPDRLRRQIDYMEDHPETVAVSSAAIVIDEFNNVVGRRGPTRMEPDMRRHLLLRNAILHSSITCRRDAILQAGGYDESLEFMEDYDLWLRMARIGPIAITPDTLIRYRKHLGQMTKAAPPWGRHMSLVARRKREYGRSVGRSASRVRLTSIPWILNQAIRYGRWKLRAGYRNV